MIEKDFGKESDVVQKWFDQSEISLAHEADQVGLFEHSVLVGSAREFIIKRVLKNILPPVVHFGSGKVFDAKGKKSRQIDIIIYDSRFPVFEIEPGIGIYPLEGVIATLEVKSTLTNKSLHEALENSMSLGGDLGSDHANCLIIYKKSSKHSRFLVLNIPFWVQNSRSKDFFEIRFSLKGPLGDQKESFKTILGPIFNLFFCYYS